MLRSLSISNFILIDELNLEFQSGLCVITGETGAGKSILLKALLFCLNVKSSYDPIKHGTNSCSVTVVFIVQEDSLLNNIKQILVPLQIECHNELIIKRTQTFDNRKKFFINDQIVTSKTAAMVSCLLFELYGQNSHTSLLDASSHLAILDDYGSLTDLRKIVSYEYHKLCHIKSSIYEISGKKQDIDREIEYLKFVVNELSIINIQENEEEHLGDLRRELQKRDKELQLYLDLLSQLETSEIHQIISRTQRIITRTNSENQYLLNIHKQLDEAANNIEEAKQQLKDIISNLSDNKYNIEEVEERLFAIKGLVRKYEVSSDQFSNFLASSKQRLDKLQQTIINSDKLHEELRIQEKKFLDLAKLLSEKRAKAALKLETNMLQELALLEMDKALFKVELSDRQVANITGIDEIRFTASTNPGAPFAAIDKIASGGELSRFMLALKSIFVDKSEVPLVIFDEIDTGVSGVAADSIGSRLKQLAKASQVIVITHQSQVAAKADQHILVSKRQSSEHTSISAHVLTEQEAIQAIARMISGKEITENSINAAKDLRLAVR